MTDDKTTFCCYDPMYPEKKLRDCVMLQEREGLSAQRDLWLRWKISLKESSYSDRKEGQEGNHAEKWDVSLFTDPIYVDAASLILMGDWCSEADTERNGNLYARK
ncbi:MAG: hypothetical protein M1497_07790 [Nitrospirae bacterium]|nr:hypothetical protein [Nitrospirota bacterium]